jgi:hypothetical protein
MEAGCGYQPSAEGIKKGRGDVLNGYPLPKQIIKKEYYSGLPFFFLGLATATCPPYWL